MNEQRRCFRLAVQEQIVRQHWILVHGIVENKGNRIPHAWLEDRDAVIVWDVESETATVRELYYKRGKVSVITRYTIGETLELMKGSEHYGPWHPAFAAYLKFHSKDRDGVIPPRS
jgi:hypothetical protein